MQGVKRGGGLGSKLEAYSLRNTYYQSTKKYRRAFHYNKLKGPGYKVLQNKLILPAHILVYTRDVKTSH